MNRVCMKKEQGYSVQYRLHAVLAMLMYSDTEVSTSSLSDSK